MGRNGWGGHLVGLAALLLGSPLWAGEPPLRCATCHGWREPVTTPRPLGPPHDALVLRHGAMWCLSCHVADAPEEVKDSRGETLPPEQGDGLCAACHDRKGQQVREGSHGKRLESWRGERIATPCRSCHNPHAPAWPAQPPEPPPRPPWEARLHG